MGVVNIKKKYLLVLITVLFISLTVVSATNDTDIEEKDSDLSLNQGTSTHNTELITKKTTDNVTKTSTTTNTKTASKTSVNACVREKLVALQRQLAEKENVVMDGRDIGTKVLPKATAKIYLTASTAQRAKRRYLELQQKGMQGNLEEIENDIKLRDHRDMTRDISPLCQAEDAVLIDASYMTIDEVTQAVMKVFEEKK